MSNDREREKEIVRKKEGEKGEEIRKKERKKNDFLITRKRFLESFSICSNYLINLLKQF